MAAITVYSGFGAQENKIYHCFHFYPFCLPRSDGTRCQELSFFNGELKKIFFYYEGTITHLYCRRLGKCRAKLHVVPLYITIIFK